MSSTFPSTFRVLQSVAAVLVIFVLILSNSWADTVLIDHTFDGVSNDTGPAFQQVSNGLGSGGSSNLSTGVITTGDNIVSNGANSSYGFNATSTINVSTAVPSATGFQVTYYVSATDVTVSDLAFNGLFFGVVSGTDATGTAGTSLWNNNPHAFGYVAGSGPTSVYGYGDNVMRQDAQGGDGNDGNSVITTLGGTAPTNASFQDGFTLTLSLYNDDTWTITSTGLSTDLNGSGSLTTTGAGMLDYASIAADVAPYVSLQGEASGTITVDRMTLTAIEPTAETVIKILSVTKENDVVTVEFRGSDGETYDLNKSTTLDFSTLNSQDSIMLNGTDTGQLQDTSAVEGAAFYRVEQQ